MQIAKVVPKVKTSGLGVFDYSIPPEILPQIQLGVLVEVPFGSRKVEGVVTDIKRSSLFTKLKPISKIIDPFPVIDDYHLKLSRWMADYYLVSMGQTLFENIVPPAKRLLKNQSKLKHRHENVIKEKGQSYLVQADFNHRLKFYLKAINKTINLGRSVLILIPDLTLIPYFSSKLKDTVILHAKLSKTKRWLAWDKIRRGSKVVVIGSISSLFAPVNNLGLIIIDQAEDEAYKNDRSPRFCAITVAEKLKEISGANLILGSLNHNIETFYRAREKKFIILKNKFQKSIIDVVDMKSEKSFLSQTLVSAIDDAIKKNQKVILLLNRKGEGSSLTCLDCGWALICDKCGLPLKPENTGAVCRNCEKTFILQTSCPKCQGLNLKKIGIGTKKLITIVQKIWPKEEIISLEKDGDKLSPNFRMAIATNYALKLPLPKIGLTAIIDADASAFLPDFRSAERDFLSFFKFLKIAKRGIVQTKNPNHFFSTALSQMDYEKYYTKELKIRFENLFPPFSHLINLIYLDRDEKICQTETQKLLVQLVKIQNGNFEILGPVPAFFRKKNNLYRWQILIKLKSVRPKELDDLLRKQNHWRIDVDPVDLT